MRIAVLIFLIGLISSCSSQKQELDALTDMMSGEFSSAEQAAQDSSFFDISLVMVPIWAEDQESNWLYVEQAVSANKRKPYRQRVYQLRFTDVGTVESKVFEIPDPESYIHAWEDMELFNSLNPDLLIERDGCSVFLTRQEGGSYSGSTRDQECKSQLRGASYATSEVSIYPDRILSWDRGWNDSGEQVWGAEKGGYIFKKQ